MALLSSVWRHIAVCYSLGERRDFCEQYELSNNTDILTDMPLSTILSNLDTYIDTYIDLTSIPYLYII